MAIKEDNLLMECNNQAKCKKLNIGKKKKFTIIEGIQLLTIMNSNNTSNLNKRSFWQNVEEQRYIPERSAEQMKAFWNEF